MPQRRILFVVIREIEHGRRHEQHCASSRDGALAPMALTGAERWHDFANGNGPAKSRCASGVRRTDVAVRNSGRKPWARFLTASTPIRKAGPLTDRRGRQRR